MRGSQVKENLSWIAGKKRVFHNEEYSTVEEDDRDWAGAVTHNFFIGNLVSIFRMKHVSGKHAKACKGCPLTGIQGDSANGSESKMRSSWERAENEKSKEQDVL